MAFKKASGIPAEPKKTHEGELIGKEGTNLIFKEKDGAHAYLPASGKVMEYLKDIAIGDVLTMEEEEGVIIWVINWVKKGKRGPLQQVQKTIPMNTPKTKEFTKEEVAAAKKKGDEIAATMIPPTHPLALAGSVPSGTKISLSIKDQVIGWESNLNTALKIIEMSLSTMTVAERKKENVITISKAVIQQAKILHDYVEEQVKG